MNNYEDGTVEDMTEENCADLEFVGRPVTKPDMASKLAALIRLITGIFNFIRMLFTGEINLSLNK